MTYLTRYRPFDGVLTLPRQLDRWMNEASGIYSTGAPRTCARGSRSPTSRRRPSS
ncbi:MAG: hypothetical protein ACREK5_06180 [Gemmatimonadota bacterium]